MEGNGADEMETVEKELMMEVYKEYETAKSTVREHLRGPFKTGAAVAFQGICQTAEALQKWKAQRENRPNDELQFLLCDDWLVFALHKFSMQVYYMNVELSEMWGEVPNAEKVWGGDGALEEYIVPIMRGRGYFKTLKRGNWSKVVQRT